MHPHPGAADRDAVPPPYVDRSVRLVVFGGIALAIGMGFALLAGLQLVLPWLVGPELSSDARTRATAAGLDLLLGAGFGWAGLGSLGRRRWARPVMLPLAWSWLATGAILCGLMPALLRGLPGLGPSGDPLRSALQIALLGLVATLGIALPAAFVWVYRDPDVERTCRVHDRRPAWTERCPTSVLGLSFLLGASAAFLLVTLPRPVVPLFGQVLTGGAAATLTLVGAAVAAVLARSTYRLRPWSFWATSVLFVATGVVASITALRVEPAELYRALGYPEAMTELVEGTGLLGGAAAAWLMLALTGLTVVYLIRLRKHFGTHDPRS